MLIRALQGLGCMARRARAAPRRLRIPVTLPRGARPPPPELLPREKAAAWGASTRLRGFAASAAAGPDLVLPSPQQLDQVVDLAKMRGEEPEGIRDIWREFHAGAADDGKVSAVLTADEFAAIKANIAACPIFVLPLLKPSEGEGAFLTLVVQHQANLSLVTSLQEYQADPAGAPFHLVITHYDELVGDKGLALVRGDCVGRHVVDTREGEAVMHMMFHFYGRPDLYKHVETFNRALEDFDFDAVVQEARKLQVESEAASAAAAAAQGGEKETGA